MKKKFFRIIGLITIVAFLSLACGSDSSSDSDVNSGGGGGTGGGLTNDIDAALFGIWKDKDNGSLLTITFSEDGIIWGGTAGNTLNTAINSYQGTGYTFVWIANNGTISYKYSDPI